MHKNILKNETKIIFNCLIKCKLLKRDFFLIILKSMIFHPICMA